jgi:hypothetical protein
MKIGVAILALAAAGAGAVAQPVESELTTASNVRHAQGRVGCAHRVGGCGARCDHPRLRTDQP